MDLSFLESKEEVENFASGVVLVLLEEEVFLYLLPRGVIYAQMCWPRCKVLTVIDGEVIFCWRFFPPARRFLSFVFPRVGRTGLLHLAHCVAELCPVPQWDFPKMQFIEHTHSEDLSP